MAGKSQNAAINSNEAGAAVRSATPDQLTTFTGGVRTAACGGAGHSPHVNLPVGNAPNSRPFVSNRAVLKVGANVHWSYGAILDVGRPPMKMSVSAKPELLKGVVVGDKVDFDVTVTGSTGEVTAINRR